MDVACARLALKVRPRTALAFLATRLNIDRRPIALVRGDTASIKLVQIEGMTLAAVRASLGE